MLSRNKKYLYFLAAFIAILIFILLIVLNWNQFCKKDNYWYNKNKMNHEVVIKDLYMECIQKASIVKSSIENEIIYSNNEESDEKKNKEETNLDKKQEIEKLNDINIYSTNPWRIKIPKLSLDAPISEGTSQESLRRTVGHFEQTDKWKGNVALAAHNRGYRCNFFQEIKQLEIGDIIIYTTEMGERKYQVIMNKLIVETDWRYIQNTKDNRITLITCETNKRDYRRCIQGIEIK